MKRSSTIAIGVFVLGAQILAATALFMFASRDAFKTKRYFVAYFEQSVTGLDIGAPIKFRGIEMGQVVSIEGVYDPQTADVIPRLELEFYPETLRNASVAEGEYTLFQPLVNRGMRASLKSQSFLTGQLYVSLDFHPNKPIRQLGSDDDPYPEMPTIDSGLGELLGTFEELPLEGLVAQITSTLDSVEGLLRNDGISGAADYLPVLLGDADAAIQAIATLMASDIPLTTSTLRGVLDGESGSLGSLGRKLENETLVTIEQSVASLTEKLTGETLGEVSSALQQTETSLGELEATLKLAQERLEPADPVSRELRTALQEISASAAAFRSLMRFIEDNPESILRGR
ncbi:MAG: MlaD family protein [Hyphomonadaceae bacterium]